MIVDKTMMLQDFIVRIRRCDCWNTLYMLEDEFKQFGLSIEQTQGRRHALCRLENGNPVVNKILDDFIFIEGINSYGPIGIRSMELITDFVWRCATGPQSAPLPKEYKRTYSLYGKPIRIENESRIAEEQEIHALGRLITE
jgi:hypothetical protein